MTKKHKEQIPPSSISSSNSDYDVQIEILVDTISRNQRQEKQKEKTKSVIENRICNKCIKWTICLTEKRKETDLCRVINHLQDLRNSLMNNYPSDTLIIDKLEISIEYLKEIQIKHAKESEDNQSLQ